MDRILRILIILVFDLYRYFFYLPIEISEILFTSLFNYSQKFDNIDNITKQYFENFSIIGQDIYDYLITLILKFHNKSLFDIINADDKQDKFKNMTKTILYFNYNQIDDYVL